MTSVLIALGILAVSHLTVDKDFPKNVKDVAIPIFIIIGGVYVIFGLIL